MKKALYALLVIVVLGALAFILGNTQLFKGDFTGPVAEIEVELTNENGQFISGLSQSDFTAYEASFDRGVAPTNEIIIHDFRQSGNRYILELDASAGAGGLSIYDLDIHPFGFVSSHSWGEPGDTADTAPAVGTTAPFASTLDYGAIVTVRDETGATRDDASVRMTNVADLGQNMDCLSLGNGRYGCVHQGTVGVDGTGIKAEVSHPEYQTVLHPMGWRLLGAPQIEETVQLETTLGTIKVQVKNQIPENLTSLNNGNFYVTESGTEVDSMVGSPINLGNGEYEIKVDRINRDYEVEIQNVEGHINKAATVSSVANSNDAEVEEIVLLSGYAVRVSDNATGTEVSNATVRLDGTDCVYLNAAAATDIYGCYLPLYTNPLPTEITAEVSADGYLSGSTSFTNIRVNHDDQRYTKQVKLIADSDNDGLSDEDETALHSTNPNVADSDSDGLTDGEEILTYGTNPNLDDTDNGGVKDGAEIASGSNPLDASDDVVPVNDTDSDGLSDELEASLGTNPSLADTDGGGVNDGTEVNVNGTDPLDPSDDVPSTVPTLACTDLDILPNTYSVTEEDANDGASLQLTINIESGVISSSSAFVPSWVNNLFASLVNKNEVILTADEVWEGTLTLQTSGSGEFIGPNNEQGSTIAIPVSGSDITIDVTYTNLQIGDKITASVGNECSDTLDIIERVSVGKFDSLATGECTHPFYDIPDGIWYEAPVCGLYENGVVQGKTSNFYDGPADVTIAEAMKILLEVAEIDVNAESSGVSINHPDVNASNWYYDYIRVAEARNILRVPSGANVYPNTPATRSQIVVWAARLWTWTTFDYDVQEFCSDIINTDPYAYAFAYTSEAVVEVPGSGTTRVTTGYANGTCRPSNNVNRAEMAAWAIRFYLHGGAL